MPVMCIIHSLLFNAHNSAVRSVLLTPFYGGENSGLRGQKFTYGHSAGMVILQSQASPEAKPSGLPNIYKEIISYPSS